MSYLRDFDLNLLRVFDAIYDTGSVSAAARKLAISQPSVSRELNRLRDHFDDPLFVRSGNGVAPTSKATGMLDDVRNALSSSIKRLMPMAVLIPQAILDISN